MSTKDRNFELVLIGETIASIVGAEEQSDNVKIGTQSGRTFIMWHEQDCCEGVSIQKVVNLEAAIGSPVISVEELIQSPAPEPAEYSESSTLTTFRITTANGLCEIIWLGESNGYYSESVSFQEELA